MVAGQNHAQNKTATGEYFWTT